MIKHIIFSAILTLLFVGSTFAATNIYQSDFNNQSTGALSLDSNWNMMSSGGVGNSPAIRLTYDKAGTPGNQATLSLSQYNTQEFWLEFDTRIEGTMNGGMKFMKVFGSLSTPSQNNSTFAMDYNSNVINRVSWYMDTICEVPFSGINYNNSCNYNAVKTGDSIDLRGNTWHHVKLHFVRASPGTNTGEYQIWIDGVERAHFTNVNNNSPASSATSKIDAIIFGDYTNSNNSTWYFWIDNLNVSTTEGSGSGTTLPPTTTPSPTTPPSTSAASLQWGDPIYSVSEGIGSASFTITRSGDSSTATSVNWGTFQNTATVNEDYTGVVWRTETFLAGETSKVVHVDITDDAFVEGDETFTLALANPTNGTLGTAPDAIVTITDNDTLGAIPPPTGLAITQVQ